MTTRHFLDAFQKCTSHGWLDWDEALLLVAYADATRGPIVEVGSYQGRSAMLLGQLFVPDYSPCLYRQIHCVDPWANGFHSEISGDDLFARFKDHIREIPGLQITPHRMRVEDWTPIPSEFVYLDGDHSYEGTVVQIKKALECKPVYIAIHDVNDSGEGKNVKRAAEELLGPWKERLSKLAVWKLR